MLGRRGRGATGFERPAGDELALTVDYWRNPNVEPEIELSGNVAQYKSCRP